MKRWFWLGGALAAVAASVAVVGATATGGDSIAAAGASATWKTVFTSSSGIEGLTGDDDGNLYVAQRGGASGCPILRIHPPNGPPTLVGTVPTPCSPSGLTFDAAGKLYVTGVTTDQPQDTIDVLTPSAASPPTATLYAKGVPGANGIAFDDQGALWATDGSTGEGRVWKIEKDGPVLMFRVPPTAAPVTGVGRQVQTLQAPGAASTQGIVANGIEFSKDGSDVFVADTARGAVWKVALDADRNVADQLSCDPAYFDKTLCPDSLLVENPQLDGADGLVLDVSGNVWVAANERNAIAVVEPNGRVVPFFQNPPNLTSRLRNDGPLETPTSPMFLGHVLCVTQSDGNRRDNSPNSGGEVGPGNPAGVAKVSCLEEPLSVKGAPLPVH